MKNESTSKASQTDWEAMKKKNDDDIDLSDIPEITAEQMAQARYRVDGESVAKGKVRVNIYLDVAVVNYFKAEAGGRGYQTLINETLKESIRAEKLETVLRRVIREELKGESDYST